MQKKKKFVSEQKTQKVVNQDSLKRKHGELSQTTKPGPEIKIGENDNTKFTSFSKQQNEYMQN